MTSSVIASRIKNVLNKLIHEDQKGFISGRFIGENIRLIYDVLFEVRNQDIPGLILSIDFEKAFDTVSWKCIEKVLGQMLRNNENITGIKINNKEFISSQYADDTQIFLDGTEISLKETLRTLDIFYLMSGLKINFEKNKSCLDRLNESFCKYIV